MAEGNLKVSGVSLVVEGAEKYQKDLLESGRALSQNAAELKKLDEQYGRGSQNVDYLTQRQQKLTEQLELQRKRTQALKDALAAYEKRQDAQPEKIAKMNLAITKSETLEARFGRQIRETGDALEGNQEALEDTEKAVTKTADAVKKADSEVKKANESVKDGTGRLHAFADAAVKAGEKMEKIGSKATRNLTAPIMAGFTYAAKEAIQFEDAYANVVKTVDADAKTLERIRQEVIDLSGSGLVTQTKEEVAQVAANAGQLGIYTENIMGFSQAMLQLEDATNLTAEAGSIGLAKFANVTGMAQDEFSNLGSAIVALGNNSATQEDAIVNLGMRLASAGTAARMSVADIMGISAAFSSVGMEAEAGGTAVSKMLIDMDTSVAKGEKAAAKYGKIAGMTGKQFQAMWRDDAASAFTAFIGGLQKIKAEGGNVALTLEKLGITDQRMRDAMMRAVSAGGVLSESISRSNTEYEKNTALAEEAAKKNSTFAARIKVLGNRFDNAAMSMGESMMPMLESGMSKLNEWVAAFGALDAGQRKNIITTGLWVAGIGPVVKIAGSVTKGVGLMSKGISALGPLMAGPAGPVLLGVAGFGALALAIASIDSPLEKIRKRMENLEFKVDPDKVKGIQEGIQQGIDAADKEYTIRAGIQVEMDALGDSVDSALSDGKLSGKERKSLKQQLNEMVKASIDEAQKDLKTSVDSYLTTLNGLKDASGQDIFTESEKAQIIADITAKTTELTGQLEDYQSEYDALMDTVYKQRKPVTTAQMAEMDALLAQIGIVRAEIQLATDEAILAAEAAYNLTVEGKGNEETTGIALGYVSEKQRRVVEETYKSQEKALAAIQSSNADEAAKIEQSAKVVEGTSLKVAEATEKANESVSAIFAGGVANAEELTKQINEAAAAYDILKGIEAAWSEEEGIDPQKLGLVLTPQILGQFGFENTSIEKMWANGDPVGIYVEEITRLLNEKIAAAAESLTIENPMTTLLKAMMAEGIEIDPAMTEGVFQDFLKVLDFSGKGAEFGLNLKDAFVMELEKPENKEELEGAGQSVVTEVDKGLGGMDGSGKSAADKLADGAINQLKLREPDGYRAAAAFGQRMIDGLNSKGGIWAGSPSRKSAISGQWFVLGATDEIDRLLPTAGKSAAKLGSELSDSLNAMMAMPRLPDGMMFDFGLAGNPDRLYEEMYGRRSRRGGEQSVTNNIDQRVPVTVQNLVVRKESDIDAIAIELDNAGRRRRMGYGSK